LADSNRTDTCAARHGIGQSGGKVAVHDGVIMRNWP
jgi:hypothetical protein